MNCLGTRVLHVLREFRDGGGGIVGEPLFELLTLCGEFDGVLVCFVLSFFFLDYGCSCKLFISYLFRVFCTRFGTSVIF